MSICPPSLFESLTQSEVDLSAPAVIEPSRIVTWAELRATISERVSAWSRYEARPIALGVANRAASIAAMAACDALNMTTYLLDADLPAGEVDRLCHAENLHAFLRAESGDVAATQVPTPGGAWGHDVSGRSRPPSTVVLRTSGTEGAPKKVVHTWETLFRPIRLAAEGPSQRWMLGYRLYLYAGLQVMAQGLANRGAVVLPDMESSVTELAAFLAEAGTTHGSATPSFWRRLLLFAQPEELSRMAFQQITLGGEAVDGPLLERIRQQFPKARVVHIYATSELGRCFSVSDGREGFPRAFLDEGTPEGVRLKIEEGELFVFSPNRAVSGGAPGFDPGDADRVAPPADAARETDRAIVTVAWKPTGDLVEVVGDRVHFVGRKGELINVGGHKVHPLQVEEVLRRVPGVLDAVVMPEASSIVGQLVACQIVLADGVDVESIRARIAADCREQLPAAAIPRVIHFVDEILLTAAGKRARGRPDSTSQEA